LLLKVKAIIDLIPEWLLEGKILRLGDFGSFNITISSEGVTTADKFTTAMIKGNNLNFRPDKLVEKALSTAYYKRITE